MANGQNRQLWVNHRGVLAEGWSHVHTRATADLQLLAPTGTAVHPVKMPTKGLTCATLDVANTATTMLVPAMRGAEDIFCQNGPSRRW